MTKASPPDSDVPSNPQDAEQWANPAWQEFHELETEFDVADGDCRKDVYSQSNDELGPAMDAFATQCATEIAQAQQYWRAIHK